MILRIKQFGLSGYIEVWEAMREFTETRGADTPDEIWLVEHPPVYTLGRNGNPAHMLVQGDSSNLLPSGKGKAAELSPMPSPPAPLPLAGEGLGRGGASLRMKQALNFNSTVLPGDGRVRDLSDIPVVNTDRGGQVTYHGPGQLVIYALFDLNRLGIGVRSLVTGLENAAIWALSQYGIKACARPDAPGTYVDGKKIASLGLRIRKGCSYHGLSLNVDMDLTPFKSINPCGYPGLEVTQLADLGVAATPLEAAVPLIGGILQQFEWEGIEAG